LGAKLGGVTKVVRDRAGVVFVKFSSKKKVSRKVTELGGEKSGPFWQKKKNTNNGVLVQRGWENREKGPGEPVREK